MPRTIKAAPWLVDELEALHRDPEFLSEDLVLDVCEQIHAAMAEEDMTQKDLAERLGKSASAVSQMLSGDQNISLRRLVEVALALERSVVPPRLVPFTAPSVEVDDGLTYSISLPEPLEPGRSLKAWATTRRGWTGDLHTTIRSGQTAGPEASSAAVTPEHVAS